MLRLFVRRMIFALGLGKQVPNAKTYYAMLVSQSPDS